MTKQEHEIAKATPRWPIVEPARLSKKEIDQLAEDIVANKVFTNWHFEGEGVTDIRVIFRFLGTISPHQFATIVVRGMGCVYEYRDKAVEGVDYNGLPVFDTCQILYIKDTTRLVNAIQNKLDTQDEGEDELEEVA